MESGNRNKERKTKSMQCRVWSSTYKEGRERVGTKREGDGGAGVEVLTFLSRGGVWILVVKREMEIKEGEQESKRRNRVNEYE